MSQPQPRQPESDPLSRVRRGDMVKDSVSADDSQGLGDGLAGELAEMFPTTTVDLQASGTQPAVPGPTRIRRRLPLLQRRRGAHPSQLHFPRSRRTTMIQHRMLTTSSIWSILKEPFPARKTTNRHRPAGHPCIHRFGGMDDPGQPSRSCTHTGECE